jgi:acyl carrier protein
MRAPTAVHAQVVGLILEMAPTPAETTSGDLLLGDDLGYDSLVVLELMFEVERTFDLDVIPEDVLIGTATVDEVAAAFVAHIEGASRA